MSKAVTIKQPYADLICIGLKDIENRTWQTKFRGRVYIHASATYPKDHRNMAQLFTSKQWQEIERLELEASMCASSFQLSAIIGHVDIADCVQDHSSIWALPNHYHWVLANPVLFDKPILNVKGKLSFWDCSQYIHS